MKKYIAGVLVLATFIIGGQTAHASFFKDVWGGLKTVIKGNQQGLGASARGATTTDTLIGDTVLTQDTFSIPESSTLPIKIPTASTPTKKITPSIEGTPINTVVPTPVKITVPQSVIPPVENIKQQIETAPSVVKNMPSSIDLSKNNILDIQNLLKEQGFFTVTPNGSFGPKTKEAVKKFQEANGLEKTGVVDTATSEALSTTKGVVNPVLIPTGTAKACTITSLTAAPAVIYNSGASSISWKTTGCTKVSLDGVTVAASGTKSTGTLTTTKTFGLSAAGVSGTVTSKITVVVKTTTLKVLTPNGGESYTEGQTMPITWVATNVPPGATFGLDLQYESIGGQGFNTTAVASAGATTVTLPTIATLAATPIPGFSTITYGKHFKVTAYISDPTTYKNIAYDQSDANFSINSTTPSLVLTSQNTGQVYTGGQKVPITWTSSQIPSNSILAIGLNVYDVNNVSLGSMGMGSAVQNGNILTSSGNDMIEIPTIAYLKSKNTFANVVAGAHFKLYITALDQNYKWIVQDESDTFFTIN